MNEPPPISLTTMPTCTHLCIGTYSISMPVTIDLSCAIPRLFTKKSASEVFIPSTNVAVSFTKGNLTCKLLVSLFNLIYMVESFTS